MSGNNQIRRINTIAAGVIDFAVDQKTITNTATKIVDANDTRHSIIIKNIGTIDIYLNEDDTVTTNNGFQLSPGDSITLEGFWWDIYGIVAAGSCKISYWDLYDSA